MCFAKSEKGYNLTKDSERREYHIANLSKYLSIWLMGGWMEKEVNAILAACYFKTLLHVSLEDQDSLMPE
jgi:hypothetical protein